ncbi:hypothetical protein BLNAU_9492 [Blattamonas nauphoetae]|uniref:Transposase n=1 Tax=Blattamonas nauphoetae TaxID=2049346 RepID=A0ABQ9XVX4_9EUKA|nr:hypothetical protein BLNAU_9492 [Blattamonas nauphoetae]
MMSKILTHMFWVEESISQTKIDCTIKENATVSWFQQFCLIAMSEVLLPDRHIGGKDVVVEVDKASFSRSEGNRGATRQKEWIVGGYCQADSTGVRLMFLERVANLDTQTLHAVLR